MLEEAHEMQIEPKTTNTVMNEYSTKQKIIKNILQIIKIMTLVRIVCAPK
jgi:hypothetical protein